MNTAETLNLDISFTATRCTGVEKVKLYGERVMTDLYPCIIPIEFHVCTFYLFSCCFFFISLGHVSAS